MKKLRNLITKSLRRKKTYPTSNEETRCHVVLCNEQHSGMAGTSSGDSFSHGSPALTEDSEILGFIVSSWASLGIFYDLSSIVFKLSFSKE